LIEKKIQEHIKFIPPWYTKCIADDFRINLQLFAKADDEGRTEEPTDYKKKKAREDEGKVVKSQELVSALVLIGSFSTIWLMGSYIFKSFKDIFNNGYSNLATFSIESVTLQEGLLDVFISILKIAGPVFLVALIFSILGNVFQFGLMFNPKLIRFDLSRIAPKMSRMFGSQAKQNLIKSIMKIGIIGGITFIVLRSKMSSILGTIDMGVNDAFGTIVEIAFLIIIITGLVLVIFSILDYRMQKKEYTEQLKMSKHEMKEERKETETDPNIVRRLREKHYEIMRMKTIEQKVPEADVIIRNPDHYAIALKYRFGVDTAPVVLSKGINKMALKIIEIAEQNKIYIHEDKSLAQMLYYSVNEEEEIPVELYQAVVGIFQLLLSKGKWAVSA
jgi:flagellar biosynthetic protein FlhB